MWILVAILLLIVIVFGVSSGMQSYATAQQAQAQIEVAKIGQISAMGNLVTILTLALVILVIVALIVFGLFLLLGSRAHRNVHVSGKRFTQPSPAAEFDPNAALGQLVQLETLKLLHGLHGPGQPVQPEALPSGTREEEPANEPFHWLK